MIGEVKIAAQSVEEVNTQTTHHMSSLMAQIEDVSATTQEMSAGMEETSASTEEMNATATANRTRPSKSFYAKVQRS